MLLVLPHLPSSYSLIFSFVFNGNLLKLCIYYIDIYNIPKIRVYVLYTYKYIVTVSKYQLLSIDQS